jgi:hypothetical protein
MYHILIFYTIVFSILLSKMNSKIVNYRMIVFTGREKSDVSDANMYVGWMLQLAVGGVVDESEREN